jgi:general secretion pathway protein B
MSIVLDALRKAEAERARGEVPGLHSGLGPAIVPLPASRVAALPWVWLAAGAAGLLVLIALVVGAGAWWRWVNSGVATPAAPAAPLAAASQPSAAPVAAPVVHAAPLTPSPAQPAAPAPIPAEAAAKPAPAAVVPLAQAKPAPAQAGASATTAATAAPIAAPAAVPASTAVPVPVPVPAAGPALPPADGRPVALADLPEEVRRELPPLNVGGLIQMDDPPRRSLIINGVIVMEGEAIQPGLVLERIGNGQAVLRHKGWRVLLGI